jgi:NADH:ubiquinone oxidoreductase subunit 4 (subunit M)
VIGIVYGALVALVQPDFKKLVAYSSVSHLGFVMLGIFALTLQSVQGAMMVMLVARPLDRRAVPPHRHDLRAPAHATSIDDVRRHRQGDAGLRACS